VKIPENIPSGYHYSIRLVSASNPNFQTMMSNVRILNTPEIKFLFTDTAVCLGSTSNILFEPLFHNAVDCYYRFEYSVGENCQIRSIDSAKNSIEVFWNRVGVAEVRVTAINIYGCRIVFTKRVNVVEKPRINFSGRSSVCANESVRYFFPNVPSIPTTVDITNGTWERINSDTIEITWENRSSGFVSIKRTAGGSCDSIRTFSVVIDSLPSAEIAGETAFCGNDTVQYFSSEQNTGNYNFLWKIDSGGKIIGSNSGVECLITGDLADKEDAQINLSLTISSKNGRCSTVIDTVILIFKPPIVPVISELDSFLVCDFYGVSYRWFCDDVEIENSNSKQIIPVVSGFYSVEILDENGCLAISDLYEYEHTSIYHSDNSDYIIKTTDEHIFIYLREGIEQISFELVDILGRVVDAGNSNGKHIIEIEKSHLPKGLYSIKLSYSMEVFFYVVLVY